MADIFNLQDTWDDAETVFNGIKLNVTDTASHADSKVLDLQVGGASKFSVDSEGAANIGSAVNSYDLTVGNVTNSLGLAVKNFGFIKAIVGPYHTTYNSSYLLRWGSSTTASNSADLILGRDAAGTLAQRDGVNAQAFRIYNTDDGAGNKEYLSVAWSASDAVLTVDSEGAGLNRALFIRGQTLFLGGAKGSNHWKISTAGHFLAQADNTYDIGAASATRPRNGYFSGTLDIAQGTLTDDAQALNITSTWNDAADTFTLVKADVTNTASAADSKLLDLQVGGASKFSVDSEGAVSIGTGIQHTTAGGGSVARTIVAGVQRLDVGTTTIGISSSASIAWNSSNYSASTGDLLLNRDSAATLQLGEDHATVATGQTIKAHDVVTGTGADLTLSGGTGSVANGAVILQPTSGNVGIGTTTPNASALLHVKGGDARFTSANDIGILIKPTNSSTSFRSTHANDDIIIETGKDFIVKTWGGAGYVEKVRILTSGNVGIGTTTPNANAILDVSSTTKAFLPPRMTTTEKNAVASPTAGMLVYDSTLNKLAVYTGAAWEAITSA